MPWPSQPWMGPAIASHQKSPEPRVLQLNFLADARKEDRGGGGTAAAAAADDWVTGPQVAEGEAEAPAAATVAAAAASADDAATSSQAVRTGRVENRRLIPGLDDAGPDCGLCVCVCAYARSLVSVRVCVCARACSCVRAFLGTCVRISVRACAPARACVCVRSHVPARVRAQMRACVCARERAHSFVRAVRVRICGLDCVCVRPCSQQRQCTDVTCGSRARVRVCAFESWTARTWERVL